MCQDCWTGLDCANCGVYEYYCDCNCQWEGCTDPDCNGQSDHFIRDMLHCMACMYYVDNCQCHRIPKDNESYRGPNPTADVGRGVTLTKNKKNVLYLL